MSLPNNILEKPTIQKTEWKSLMISNRDSNSDQLFAKNKIAKKPKWIRVKLPTGKKYAELRGLVDKYKLNTICSSGSCPNMGECWGEGTATFMILGNICIPRTKAHFLYFCCN